MIIKSSLLAFAAVAVLGCRKVGSTGQMTVKMTDAPGDFEQVNVDIREVQVQVEGHGWVNLPTNQGVYDLLTLQNDITTILVNEGELPAGHVNQFRLVLGSSNTVKVDGLYFPLATPGAQQSGLKININADVAPNETYELLIDFDAGESIVEEGNGGYSLKPVIKLAGIVEL